MSILKARVAARNRANAYGIKLYNELEPIFRRLLGVKIYNKDGSLAKRVQDKLPVLGTDTVSVYKYSSEYSLMYVVKVNEPVEGKEFTVYEECNVYIGGLRDGYLTEISSPPDNVMYSVERVEHLREQYKEAKRLADNLLSQLHPFGEYDR